MNQVIEPEFKFLATGSVSIAQQKNHKLIANVQVEPNFDRNPIYAAATVNQRQEQGQEQKPTQSVGPTEETDQKKLNQAKAAYNKCIQVLNKLQFPEEQGQQICQLLTETMILAMEDEEQSEQDPNQQQNNLKQNKPPAKGTPSGNVTQQRPPMSGFVGNTINGTTTPASTCARTAAMDRELAIKREQVQQLNAEVAKERQAHLQRVARIASLENTLHRLKLDKYLSDYIVDEPVRDWQVRKMASKGMTVDDLREIYEGVPTRTIRTASNNNSIQKQIPKSKVRLRTASTDESNSSDRHSHLQHTNDKFTNAYLGNNNLYDDYIA